MVTFSYRYTCIRQHFIIHNSVNFQFKRQKSLTILLLTLITNKLIRECNYFWRFIKISGENKRGKEIHVDFL